MRVWARVMSPWWGLVTWWHKRRLYHIAGRGDRRLGERIVKQAFADAVRRSEADQ